ncbi:MAG: trigger factor [Patescibacteria group bacterium]
MNAKVEKLKNSRVKMTITVEASEMVNYFEKAYEKLAPSVSLAGFRPGKAPKDLTESSIGITRLLSEGLDAAINESYVKALTENQLNPLSSPNIAINKYPEFGHNAEEIKNDLEYTAEIDLYPEVTLGDYSKLKVDLPKKEEAKDEDIQKILDNLLKQKASFSDIDRETKIGDLAEVSFEGSIKKVKIDAMCSKNHPVVIGEKSLIPGFEEEIIGMKKGESKEFKIKFPKDYHSKEYAGKDAEFKVTLNNLKEVKMPELDDAFAADFGQKNVSDLKGAIKKNLEHELDQKYEQELENKVLEKVLPLVKADLPDTMIDHEVERMIEGYKKQLEGMNLNFDAYLASTKKTIDDLKKEMHPTAERNVKIGLLLGKIVEEQKIDHHSEDAAKKAIDYLVKTLTK